MGAGTAQADNLDIAFVTVLENEGIFKSASDDSVIELGHDVCGAVDRGSDLADVARVFLRHGSSLTPRKAGFFVGASITAYCPEYKYLLG